jgi:hypothetical protein
MATLGRREMIRKNRPNPPEVPAGVASPSVNLRAVPTTIHPVTTLDVQPSFLGSPIMREGFITATGVMPTKFD